MSLPVTPGADTTVKRPTDNIDQGGNAGELPTSTITPTNNNDAPPAESTLNATTIRTVADFVALKTRHDVLKAEDKVHSDQCAAENKAKREAAEEAARKAGVFGKARREFMRKELMKDWKFDFERSKLMWDKMSALKLPHPPAIAFPLTELSADFKRAHHVEGTDLWHYNLADGEEWEESTLVDRIEDYILMRFGASKATDEAGNVTYMSIESVHNLWVLLRHLINEYTTMAPFEKGKATSAFKNLTERIIVKYDLKAAGPPRLALPGPSDIPHWSDFWYRFEEQRPNITLRDMVEFDLSDEVPTDPDAVATVSDGHLTHVFRGFGAFHEVKWTPDNEDQTA